ncbi:MAG: phosphopantetheine-binding protein [Candidatus Binatia bacterium]
MYSGNLLLRKDRSSLAVGGRFPFGADFKKRAIEKPYIAPRNPIEEALALVWAEVLGIDKVSVDDDFFDLGGHSLAVTQVISRLQERFQAEFSVRSVLEAPAFADMAALISQTQAKRFKPDDVNRILSDLESMSDDEAQYLVARSETQTAKN